MACKSCKKAKNIVHGFATLGRDVIKGENKYEFTDSRVRICQKCDKRYWIGRALWCKLCKCFVPAKARVPDEKCPINKWES